MNIDQIELLAINNQDNVDLFLNIIKNEKTIDSMTPADWVGEFIYEIHYKGSNVGFISYSRWNNACCLSCIYVFENFRHKGIAAASIRKLLTMTKQYHQLYGFVHKDNVNAIKLYQKLGFKFLNQNTAFYDLAYPDKEARVSDDGFYEFGMLRR